MTSATVLSIRGLGVRYAGAPQPALADIGLNLGAGERLGVVGASGSGKSTLAMAVPALLPSGSAVTGSIQLAGEEVIGGPPERLVRLRREVLGLVFQDPVGALNPVRSIGSQMDEALALQGEPRGSRAALGLELLSEAGLEDPRRVSAAFPHEISGGMAQRVSIALALTGSPALLIADEPTTALDVVTQRRILDLLVSLSESRGTALLIVSHDLPVIASVCERVIVMAGGSVVEAGATSQMFRDPRHPATQAMVDGVMALRRRDRS